MPIALVALDLDGTLLRTDKQLTAHTARTIAAVLRRGVRVVLASARPPRSVREVYRHLHLDTPQINYNGALIYDPHRRRNLLHLPITAALTKQIIHFARKLEPGLVVSVEILDKWYTDRVDEALPTETSRRFNPDFIGPLDAIVRTPVTKLILLGRPEILDPVRRAVARKFAGQIAIAVSDPHLIQVMNPQADKGRALAHIAEQYQIVPAQVMAIGDAPNDLGMLAYAGLAVTVENAWPAVRAKADFIVPSNNHDGVAHALRRFILDA
jgi:Cof subfamily protein (haloacid dehalogenase superfamily)